MVDETSQRGPVLQPVGRRTVLRYSLVAQRNYGEDHRAATDDTSALMAVDTASCPHPGCAVPWRQSSRWFECPCHGSRCNGWGEWTDSPAPRELDRYTSFIDEVTGQFVVDLGSHLTGPARTANALEQKSEGPACVNA